MAGYTGPVRTSARFIATVAKFVAKGYSLRRARNIAAEAIKHGKKK